MTYLAIDGPARRLTLEELKAMPGAEIPADSPHRIDLDLGYSIVPLLVVRRPQAERLVVLNNGSVSQERSEGRPVFQRSTWWSDIDAHQIFVCDPGTVGTNAYSLNWLQAERPRWIVRDLMRALLPLSRSLGISRPEQRHYYGSSAGGFATLLELAYDRRARATVNNPQIDWTRWYAHQVRPVLSGHFPGLNAKQVRERFPKRANCLQSLADAGVKARVDYWVNMASAHDRDVQLPISLDFIRAHPEICRSFSVHMYYDEAMGHNPLPKDRTIEILNRD